MITRGKQFWLIYSALVFLVLIRIIPILYPALRTWGFNHLIFLPSGYSIAFFAIAAIALILPFFKKIEIWGEVFINRFSSTFFENQRKFTYRLIFVFFITSLFIAFTASTHFLGDGYSLISIIASDTGRIIKWSESGFYVLMYFISSLFGAQNTHDIEILYQVISILSGMASIWFYFLIAQYASSSATKRLVIFSFSLISGSLLLFFGYVEHYPLLWAFLTGYLYLGLKFLQTGRGIIPIIIVTVLGSVLHLLMAILWPSTICLILISDKWAGIVKRYKFLIIGMIVTATIALTLLFINMYTKDLGVRAVFLNFFHGVSSARNYFIFSKAHIIDILNEIIIVAPLFIAVVLGRKSSNLFPQGKNNTIFLALISFSFLIFLFVIDPKLGMPRDWDLFSISIFPGVIFLTQLIAGNQITVFKRLIIPVLVILFISVLPFLVTNLDEVKSVKYNEYLISIDFEISRQAIYIESGYFEKRKEYDKADSLKALYQTEYPRWNKYDRAAAALKKHDIDGAAAILNAIEPNLYDAYYQKLMGRYHFLLGNFEKSLYYTNNAVQLRPYLASTYGERADIYLALDSIDKGFDDLRQGYRLDNRDVYILDLLVMAFSGFKKYDSCIYYGHKRLQVDSTSWPTYYEMAKAYAHEGKLTEAKKYFDKFAAFDINRKGYISKVEEVKDLIKKQSLDR